jgi:hypothetical protein
METMKKIALLAISGVALLTMTACAYDDYDYRNHPHRGDWHHDRGDRDHDHHRGHGGGGHHHGS